MTEDTLEGVWWWLSIQVYLLLGIFLVILSSTFHMYKVITYHTW